MPVCGEAVCAAQRGVEERAVFAVPLEPKAFTLLAKALVLLNFHQEGRSC